MLFKCSRSEVNHCFHQRCLYLHFEEISRTAGFDHGEFKKGAKKNAWKQLLRCTLCSDNQYDIHFTDMNQAKVSRVNKKDKRKQNSHNRSDSSSNSSLTDDQFSRDYNVMDNHRQSIVALDHKQAAMNNKLMAKFDTDFHNSTLHKDNFDD